MQVNPSIFRTYDIRGVAGKEFSEAEIKAFEKYYGKFTGITLTTEVANALGKAYGTFIRSHGGTKVAVGYEKRPFGEELKNEFIAGVVSTGLNLVDIGVTITPMVYFAISNENLDGGVCITGSHNIYFYNGLKFSGRGVSPIYGKELKQLQEIIESENYMQDAPGKLETKDISPEYSQFILSKIKLSRPLKVVVDCGNGTAGLFLPSLLKNLGCEVIELFTTPDSTFPNHTPDPSDPYLMKDLKAKVLETHAELGIGADADGDRLGVVDENGNYIFSDILALIFIQDVLSRNPGKKILFDVKSSQVLERQIKSWGGIPLIHATGHAPIKHTLREDPGVIFASELSGHFFFVEDLNKYDDGVYAACKLLEILSKTNEPISEVVSKFPATFSSPELKVGCSDETKEEIVSQIAKSLASRFETLLLDGARFKFSPTAWGLIRSSNTGPSLGIRVEGGSESEALQVKNIIADELEKYPQITTKLDRTQIASHAGPLGWI